MTVSGLPLLEFFFVFFCFTLYELVSFWSDVVRVFSKNMFAFWPNVVAVSFWSVWLCFSVKGVLCLCHSVLMFHCLLMGLFCLSLTLLNFFYPQMLVVNFVRILVREICSLDLFLPPSLCEFLFFFKAEWMKV